MGTRIGADSLSRGEIFGALCGLLLSVVGYLTVTRLDDFRDFQKDAVTRIEELERELHTLRDRVADAREASADRERRLRDIERSCKTP